MMNYITVYIYNIISYFHMLKVRILLHVPRRPITSQSILVLSSGKSSSKFRGRGSPNRFGLVRGCMPRAAGQFRTSGQSNSGLLVAFSFCFHTPMTQQHSLTPPTDCTFHGVKKSGKCKKICWYLLLIWNLLKLITFPPINGHFRNLNWRYLP